ncbi:WYL domain-containing protein [Mobilitalea sibirica]|uniref:WYL domain-containing protein n=1 Tax=Mobilitalea sibirica TaxID=1462919 RepID=A0A8J7H3G2_9FIRM|nr:WYL domain-containing protein [Mobilitalea sibirica]MBH1941612.1 WYL domain-containing protein [Mobilitalea sibirica]
MKDMAQTERQIFILLLLSENKRGYTINDIHASLEKWDVIVDKKTIMRDIDSLSGICFISEEERCGKTYYTADKFRLRDITFTSPELISLAFLLELLKPYQYMTMGKTSQELIHKLLDNTTNLNREFIKHFTGLVTINTNDYISDSLNPEIENKLQEAIRNKSKVRIIYHSFAGDEDTIRVIQPYELMINDGALSVVGYCELRNDIRDFRVSRIRALTSLEETFTVPEAYHQNKDRNKFIHLSGNVTEQIIIAFDKPTAKYIMEYEFDLADEIIETEDGITFMRNTAVTDELIRWILQYGPGARVLNPAHLKDKIRQELSKSLNQYLT